MLSRVIVMVMTMMVLARAKRLVVSACSMRLAILGLHWISYRWVRDLIQTARN